MRFFYLFFFITSLTLYSQDKPNVIVIVADDLGYADVGFHGVTAPDVHTPNLDKLANNGITFSRAYSASPICSNSRLALITGRYPQRWGAYYYGQGGLPSTEFTIAEMMQESGYRTMKVGKTHLNHGPKADPMKHGFDHWLGFHHHSWDYFLLSEKDVAAYEKKVPGSTKKAKKSPIGPLTRDSKTLASFENTNTTEVFTNEAIRFIEQKSDKPFYLQVEYNAVHTIMTRAPKAMRAKYDVPERAFNREDAVWEFPLWDPIVQPDYKKWYRQNASLGKIDPYGRKVYLAHLEYMDLMIGNIIKALKASGLYDNTLIIFSSDNGGSHQSYANNGEINTYKFNLMEGGIRVPMFLHWPNGFNESKEINAIVTHRDIYPSIVDILDYDAPKSLDGKSLIPLIDGNFDSLHTDPLFWDSGNKMSNWVVHWENWKLVWKEKPFTYYSYQLDKKGLVTGLEKIPLATGLQLYDLSNDAIENENVVHSYPEKVLKMKEMYYEWRSSMAEPMLGKNAK